MALDDEAVRGQVLEAESSYSLFLLTHSAWEGVLQLLWVRNASNTRTFKDDSSIICMFILSVMQLVSMEF